MSDFVIVIGRQYGAGGRRLGKLLAEKLNIPYYDKELLAEAAHSLGFSPEFFKKADEKRPSFIRSLLSFNYGATSAADNRGALTEENLYQLQSQVIRSICEKGSCVIVGRTADYVMRDHPGLLSIFVHAPEQTRAENILSRGESASIEEALEKAHKNDKCRESYYNYYTNRTWGTAANYDLTIDSSKFTLDEIASFIISHLPA